MDKIKKKKHDVVIIKKTNNHISSSFKPILNIDDQYT